MEHFSSNGIIRITRKIYWYRGEGRDARLDRWLGIQDNNVSVAAREMCCRSSVGGIGFVKAAEVLERLGSIRISKEWMREIVESEGRVILQPLTEDYFEQASGVLSARGGLLKDFLAERRREKEREDKQ